MLQIHCQFNISNPEFVICSQTGSLLVCLSQWTDTLCLVLKARSPRVSLMGPPQSTVSESPYYAASFINIESVCFLPCPRTIWIKYTTISGLLLLLLSCFSRVWLCATPEMAAHRLPRPWDSPGKNTGVGCHFLLQCMKVKSESVMSDSSRPHGLQPTRLLHPWDFPGKSTGVGCHRLLQPHLGSPQMSSGSSKYILPCLFAIISPFPFCILWDHGRSFLNACESALNFNHHSIAFLIS